MCREQRRGLGGGRTVTVVENITSNRVVCVQNLPLLSCELSMIKTHLHCNYMVPHGKHWLYQNVTEKCL